MERPPDSSGVAALVWALLPLCAALCRRDARPPAACAAPATADAVVACREGPASLGGAVQLLFGGGLDPNRAAATELELLPGIGPARAAAIAAARERGAFQRVEDLQRAHGVGPATIEKLRPWLQIDPHVADP